MSVRLSPVLAVTLGDGLDMAVWLAVIDPPPKIPQIEIVGS